MWTLEQGLELIRSIEPKLREIDWYSGLTGGVLYKGESSKDLDIIVSPLSYSKKTMQDVRQVLLTNGLKMKVEMGLVMEYHGNKNRVEVYTYVDKRVDVFFMTCGNEAIL